MIDIDWGDLTPTLEVRTAVEARMRELRLARERVTLRRCGNGYEAQVRTAMPGRSTVLRLHGEDLYEVVDRTAELLSIVARSVGAHPRVAGPVEARSVEARSVEARSVEARSVEARAAMSAPMQAAG